MRALVLESLAVRGLRNLAAVDLEPGPRFNVLAGDNGAGKTSLLEAIYVLATSRSFRATRPGELVAHGADSASVKAHIREGAEGVREQVVGLRHGGRLVRVDGKRPPTLASYAIRTPAVVFHPGTMGLSMGGGAERRRLLDRVALYVMPASLSDAESYAKAQKARQRALETRGVSARDLEDWEELMVRHGMALAAARRDAAARLAAAAEPAFERIAAPAGTRPLKLSVRYTPGAPEDEQTFRAKLAECRAQDLRRGNATVGLHRDDLALDMGPAAGEGDAGAATFPVRGVASQGQHRAVVLALKLAEIEVVAAARGVRPILLLDDVSSELDPARTAALFAFLRDLQGQVFLTTTRRELIDTGSKESLADRRDFWVENGRITALPS